MIHVFDFGRNEPTPQRSNERELKVDTLVSVPDPAVEVRDIHHKAFLKLLHNINLKKNNKLSGDTTSVDLSPQANNDPEIDRTIDATNDRKNNAGSRNKANIKSQQTLRPDSRPFVMTTKMMEELLEQAKKKRKKQIEVPKKIISLGVFPLYQESIEDRRHACHQLLKHINQLKTPHLQKQAKILFRTHKSVIDLAKKMVQLEKQIEKESKTEEHAIIIDEQVFNEVDVSGFVRSIASQATQGFAKSALGPSLGGAAITAVKALAKKPVQKTIKQKPLRQIVPQQQPKKKRKYSIQILKPDEPRTRPGYQLRQMPGYQHLNEVFLELITMRIEEQIINRWEKMHGTII
jgi:hypothetical protein